MGKQVKGLMKGIYLRGRLYWFAIQRQGKRVFIPLNTADPAEAVRKADEIRRSDVVESGTILKHAVDRFVASQMKNGLWTRSTHDSKSYVLKGFAKWCGPLVPSEITPDRVRKFYDERREAKSPRTAHGNLMTIRSFFNWCRDIEKTVRENPCEKLKIKAPKAAARKDFCTAAQRDYLIENAPTEELRFILYCGFHAGLRFNEIIESRPFWFDLGENLLNLRKTATIQFKDQEERTIPLTREFRTFLTGYGLPDPFMIRPEKGHGKDRYRCDFGPAFTKYMEAQDFKWVTPHIMRHTFASLLVSAGVSIYKVAVWLGDDVRVVQRHYGKLIPKDDDIDLGITHHRGKALSHPQGKESQSYRTLDRGRAGHRA